MNTTSDIRVAAEGRAGAAFARSQTYSLLAQGLRYPERGVFALIQAGSYAEALQEALADACPGLVDGFRLRIQPRLAFAEGLAEFEAEYLAAFENNLPKPSVSLYEGSHGESRGNKASLLLELKGFYRNFGLSMADNDMEDALVAELEFMQFLAAKQAMAEQGALDRTPYIMAQRDFMQRHLSAWLPILAAEAAAIVQNPFYLALIEVTTEFVTADRLCIEADVENLGL